MAPGSPEALPSLRKGRMVTTSKDADARLTQRLTTAVFAVCHPTGVTEEFRDEWGEPKGGTEALDAWETSSGGPIGHGDVHFETMKIGDEEVWAIAQLQ